MFDDLDSLIDAGEASGWDGNWTSGEDFLSGFDVPYEAPLESGPLGMLEGSPNVGSPTEAEMASVTQGSEEPSAVSKITKALGLTNKEGKFDWSDPKTLDKLVKLGLGLGGFIQGARSNKQAQQAQQSNLLAQLQQQARNSWTPQQAIWANQYFQTPSVPRTVTAGQGGIQSIVPSRGYAEGGPIATGPQDIFARTRRRREQEVGVEDYNPQTLQPGTNRVIPEGRRVPVSDLLRSIPALIRGALDDGEPREKKATGGALGLLEGPGDGQSDSIPIDAARGEYVIDASTVADIGNGSNEAGAEILREWTENLRKHKRSVSHKNIPPPTKDLNAYLPKGAK